ncbi:MAG: MarR family transcriptional regulator [Lachnospiraceae bacterium]|nr:MarR family transcriptional regulator [Lachnospiraceae bacterium]
MDEPHRFHIGFEIKQTFRLIKKYIDRSTAVQCANQMTGTHVWILKYLQENRGKEIFQKDIEKQFGINRSSATGLLQLMEKNGLIYREEVPYDARLKRIVMTKKAVSLDTSVRREIDLVEERISRGFSEEELQTLIQMLSRIRDNLNRSD